MTITAPDALPGDVLLDTGGTEWKRGDTPSSWSTFSGPVLVFGPWHDRYGPQGDLVLLVRDGKPASGSDGIDGPASAFATRHGSFTLHFDVSENYGGREPCPLPWTAALDGAPERGWGGHSAQQALEEAEAGLGPNPAPGSPTP